MGQVGPSPKELILIQLCNQAVSGFGTGGKGEEKEVQNSKTSRDFHGGPLVKNPPCSARDVGSIPGRGIKILQAVGLLSPQLWNSCTTTREPSL